MTWSRTKFIWLGTIIILVIFGLIIATVFAHSKHSSTSSTSQTNTTLSGQNLITALDNNLFTVTFREYTADGVQKWEHDHNQNIWSNTKGQLSPFQLRNGMQFKLMSTTDSNNDKYVGKSFTLTIGSQEYQGHMFPTLLLLKDSSNQYIAGMDLISGIDWSNYLTSHGVQSKEVNVALDKTELWVLKVTSGPQSGKEISIKNYTQFCKMLYTLDSTNHPMLNTNTHEAGM